MKLWDLDGNLLLTLEGHKQRALNVAFHPVSSSHGSLLASSGLDDIVILWQLDRLVDTNQVLAHGCDWIRDYLQTQPQY
ncbi:MAG: hypothetical protein ACFE0I_21075 [Elainellaceae cyanobacterium]